jgi:methionyl-tRNA formyltransferase
MSASECIRVAICTVERQWLESLASLLSLRNRTESSRYRYRVVCVLTSRGPARRRSTAFLDIFNLASELCKCADEKGADDDQEDGKRELDLSILSEASFVLCDRADDFARVLAPFSADLILCCGFPWLLRNDLLRLPSIGCFNVHNSLLPRYRGPNAVGHVLRNCDRRTGATVHTMLERFDCGRVLAQRSVDVTLDDDAQSLGVKLVGAAGDAWRDALGQIEERLSAGDVCLRHMGVDQSDMGVEPSLAPLFDEADRHIDVRGPHFDAQRAHCIVRSFVGHRDIALGALVVLANGATIHATKSRFDRATQTLTLAASDGSNIYVTSPDVNCSQEE